MPSPLLSKLMSLGLAGVLGGVGLVAGPAIGPKSAETESLAPMAVELENVGLDEELEVEEPDVDDEEIDDDDEQPTRGRSAAAHARRDSAHVRRDARAGLREARHEVRRSAHTSVREARRAMLDARGEPGEGPRGIGGEARSQMRELRLGATHGRPAHSR